AQRRNELRRLGLAGTGIDPEESAVAVTVDKGVDRVDQASLFSDLLEQAGGHAAAEGSREHCGGVVVRVVEHDAGKAHNNMQLFEIAVLAPVAAGVAGGLCRGGPLRRQTSEQLPGKVDDTVMIEMPGSREHHAPCAVM